MGICSPSHKEVIIKNLIERSQSTVFVANTKLIGEITMKSLFEQNGGIYRMVNGYRIPNLTLPNEPEYHIGIWGQRRLDYLKKHRKCFHTVLLTSGKLAEHLHEIDETANERRELIVKQMKVAQGVPEQLKSSNGMKWVCMVNNICACADEIIRAELIYE